MTTSTTQTRLLDIASIRHTLMTGLAHNDALAALDRLAAQPPEEWQAVPIDLDDEVRNVLIDRCDKISQGRVLLFVDIWRDILAAAPQPPAGQQDSRIAVDLGITKEDGPLKSQAQPGKAIGFVRAPATSGEATAAQGADWLPIETAPKDGTEILGYCDGAVQICSWEELNNPVAQHWRIPGTWHRRDITSGKGLMGGNFRPTHWMPLPAAPSPAAPGNGEKS